MNFVFRGLTDWLGGSQKFELVRTQIASTSFNGPATALSPLLTGSLLILCDVGSLGTSTISCQLQSSPNETTWNNYGTAFGVAAGFTVQDVDLESFPAANIRVAVTVGGTSPSVPIVVLGIGWLKYN